MALHILRRSYANRNRSFYKSCFNIQLLLTLSSLTKLDHLVQMYKASSIWSTYNVGLGTNLKSVCVIPSSISYLGIFSVLGILVTGPLDVDQIIGRVGSG